MNLTDKALTRTAAKVREHLAAQRTQPASQLLAGLDSILHHTERLARARTKLALCIEKSMSAAQECVRQELASIISTLARELTALAGLAERKAQRMVSLREIIAELQQIGDEFPEWSFSPKAGCLSATTGPIELEGIYLGRFSIQLRLKRPSAATVASPLSVEALEPHPAASDPHVRHPHVQGTSLCAGEATVPLRTALESGRLCDFFMMVRSVLTTYNPESPYVKLEEWDGVACYECGFMASGDDLYWCDCCQRDFCSECFGSCAGCDASLCTGCLSLCSGCELPFCESCMGSCTECGKPFCGSCLEDGLCESCADQEGEEDAEERAQSQACSRSHA